MLKYSLVIVGGGMAAARLVQRLATYGYNRSVLVLSREAHFGYNRVLLPSYLGRECELEELMTASVNSDWITVLDDCEVLQVDPVHRTVHANRGSFEYENLVFATGSDVPQPNSLRCLPDDIRLTLRSLADNERLEMLCGRGQKLKGTAVVVGGGLLGLEAAGALLKRGMQVHVIHRNKNILNRQLDETGSEVLRRQLEARGYKFHLGRKIVSSIVESVPGVPQRSVTLGLDNKSRLSANIVLLATGTTPRIDLADKAGIHCDRGITVNGALQTNFKDHYAIGECAEFEQQTCGLVEPTHSHADVVAQNLCGTRARYQVPETATRLKISGIQLFSMGDTTVSDQQVVIDSSDHSIYRCLNYRQQKLVGAVLLGDISGARAIQQKMGQTMDESSDRERLAFGF